MKKLLTAISLLTLAAPVCTQASRQLEDLLPSNTFFIVGIHDFDRLCRESREGPLNDLANNRQISDILQPAIDAVSREFEESKEEEIISWKDIRDCIGGQIVMGFDPRKIFKQVEKGCNVKNVEAAGLFLFAETKDDNTLTHLFASAFEEESEQKDSGLIEDETETFMGEDIHHFEFVNKAPANDVGDGTEASAENEPAGDGPEAAAKIPAAPKNNHLYFGNVEDIFFATFDLEDARKAVEAIKGDEKDTLCEEERIAQIHSLSENSDLYFHFYAKPFTDLAEKGIRDELAKGNAQSPDPTKPDADTLIQALGMDSLKSFAMSARFDPEYVRFDSTFDYDSSYGVGRLFRAIGDNYPTPDFVKDSTTRSIASTAFNFTTFFSEIKNIVFAAVPSTSMIYQAQVAQMVQQCGVNLDTDLFGAYDEGLIIAMVDNPDKSQSMPLMEVLPVYAFKLKDAPTFLHNFSTLLAAMQPAPGIQTKNYNGNEILAIPAKNFSFFLSAKDEWLLASVSEAAIQSMLSTSENDKSFWQSARYSEINNDRLPSGGCGMSYCDFDLYARNLLTAFAIAFNTTAGKNDGGSSGQAIDLSLVQSLRDLPFVICGKVYKTAEGLRSETYLYKK